MPSLGFNAGDSILSRPGRFIFLLAILSPLITIARADYPEWGNCNRRNPECDAAMTGREAAAVRDPSRCLKTRSPWICFQEMAFVSNDPSVCAMIPKDEDPLRVGYCYEKTAQKLHDPAICDKIPLPSYDRSGMIRLNCRESVRAKAARDSGEMTQCIAGWEPGVPIPAKSYECIQVLAWKTKNPADCNKIQGEAADLCRITVAYARKDCSLVQATTGNHARSVCESQLAKAAAEERQRALPPAGLDAPDRAADDVLKRLAKAIEKGNTEEALRYFASPKDREVLEGMAPSQRGPFAKALRQAVLTSARNDLRVYKVPHENPEGVSWVEISLGKANGEWRVVGW